MGPNLTGQITPTEKGIQFICPLLCPLQALLLMAQDGSEITPHFVNIVNEVAAEDFLLGVAMSY